MGAIPNTDFNTQVSHANFNTDPVNPVQYALVGSSVLGSFEPIYELHQSAFEYQEGINVTNELIKIAPTLLKYSIGKEHFLHFAQLSMKERYHDGKVIGGKLHQAFNEFILQHCPEIALINDWVLTLEIDHNGIKVKLEPQFYTLILEPKSTVYQHPKHKIISDFMLHIANRLGARHQYDLLDEQVWELECYLELSNEKEFIDHYGDIVEFYDSLEDDVVEKFNNRWGEIITLIEECRPEIFEIQLALLLEETPKLPTFEELRSKISEHDANTDPLLNQLVTDISWLEKFEPLQTIDSSDAEDYTGQHIYALSEQISDMQPAYIEALEDTVNSNWNNGGSYFLTVDTSNNDWLCELRCFGNLWSMALRYFEYSQYH